MNTDRKNKTKAIAFFDKFRKTGIIASSLTSISEYSGIAYSQLRSWLRYNRDVYEDDNVILFRSEYLKASRKGRIENLKPKTKKDETD